MGKRKKLEYNSKELTENLKQSTGKGIDAFFSSPQSPTEEADAESNSEKASEESKITEQPPADKQKQTTKPDKAYGRTDEANDRTGILFEQIPPVPEQRRPERYAFQFWADQITRLKKLNQVLNLTKDPEDRDETTLSDMVREAIDDYLTKQIDQTKKDVRSSE